MSHDGIHRDVLEPVSVKQSPGAFDNPASNPLAMTGWIWHYRSLIILWIISFSYGSIDLMPGLTTRRQAVLILCGALLLPAQTENLGASIEQDGDFKVSPARLYDALHDCHQFSAFT